MGTGRGEDIVRTRRTPAPALAPACTARRIVPAPRDTLATKAGPALTDRQVRPLGPDMSAAQ
nr:hypothetical protein KPHV_15570 [Kitasatospora purpeofusca]